MSTKTPESTSNTIGLGFGFAFLVPVFAILCGLLANVERTSFADSRADTATPITVVTIEQPTNTMVAPIVSAPTEQPTTVTVVPTATAEPVADENAILLVSDAENGQVLFNTFQVEASFACATCHYPDREDRLIGPGLLNVSIRAETRVEGQSALDYIYTSIVTPSVYVVADFSDNLMPKNWAEIYSEDEIYDIIAYLFTLRDS